MQINILKIFLQNITVNMRECTEEKTKQCVNQNIKQWKFDYLRDLYFSYNENIL